MNPVDVAGQEGMNQLATAMSRIITLALENASLKERISELEEKQKKKNEKSADTTAHPGH